MAAIGFVPADPVRYTANCGRQLEFTQIGRETRTKEEGEVSVRVYYGTNKISTISQRNIFVEKNTIGLRQLERRNLAALSKIERKTVLSAIEAAIDNDAILDHRSSAYLEIENGEVTDITHRQTGAALFSARSITVILK